MGKKRIVVTGMGVVSALGNDVDLFYQSLLEGKSGVSPITGFNCEEFSTRIAAEIKNFDPESYIDKKQARRIDPCIAYGMVAAKKALEMAGFQLDALDPLNRERCGVLIGSGMGGMNVFVEGVTTLLEKGPKRVSPFFIPYILTNMTGAMCAIDLGFMGPNYSVSTACATSNNAIIAAANHIRLGDADLMLCGGAEAAINPVGLAGFCACKALSQRNDAPEKASRPWDTGRDGFVMGEGAGVIVLESLEHAQARGATILAEYLGHGLSCDASHITEPRSDGSGVAICIKSALRDAGISPEEVDYINAHATSTPVGDMAEIRAMRQVFSHPERVSINSTKSMIGHSLGAAGALEAIATVKAVMHDLVHPTLNLENPDSELAFRAPTQAEARPVRAALSNSFGFGGHNATIAFGKYRV